MNWTQPICWPCWHQRFPDREPHALIESERQSPPPQCCDCGGYAMDGIYFRIDPRTVRFPQEKKP